MKKFLILILVLSATSSFAFAEEKTAIAVPYYTDTAVSPQNCKMTETNTIGVNFNNIPVEAGKAKAFVDEKMTEIENLAKAAGLQKFELQNFNYNVYANNNYGGGCAQTGGQSYMMNASVSYLVDDATKAADLVKGLEAKGYQINLNSNAYRQCQ